MQARKKRRTPVSSSGLVIDLREEVHSYHLEVTQALATMQANCLHCQKRMNEFDLELNGDNPENKDAPGIKSIVKAQGEELSHLKKSLHTGWVIATTIFGLITSWFSWKR